MPHPRHTPAKVAVALSLTFAAGYVDAVGFLAFWRVFTAHMTGNTVHLGIDIIQRHWGEALRAGLPVPVFLLGSLLGRCILEYGVRRRWRRVASIILLFEAAGLSEVIWLAAAGNSRRFVWASLLLLAGCMGLQTAALTRIGPLTVHTTFVTGMLNSLAQRLSHLAFALAEGGTQLRSTRAVREAALLVGVWIAYAAGAIAGAGAFLAWSVRALFVVLAILFAVIGADEVRPLSIEEEEEEANGEIPLGELRKAS